MLSSQEILKFLVHRSMLWQFINYDLTDCLNTVQSRLDEKLKSRDGLDKSWSSWKGCEQVVLKGSRGNEGLAGGRSAMNNFGTSSKESSTVAAAEMGAER